MRSQMRPYDAIGRFGGDEFLFLLIDCTLEQAQHVCERIRIAVAHGGIEFANGITALTISIGLVTASAAGTRHPR